MPGSHRTQDCRIWVVFGRVGGLEELRHEETALDERSTEP